MSKTEPMYYWTVKMFIVENPKRIWFFTKCDNNTGKLLSCLIFT